MDVAGLVGCHFPAISSLVGPKSFGCPFQHGALLTTWFSFRVSGKHASSLGARRHARDPRRGFTPFDVTSFVALEGGKKFGGSLQ